MSLHGNNTNNGLDLSSFLRGIGDPNSGGASEGGFLDDINMGGIADFLKGISSIYGAYQGGQSVDLAGDQFDFQKGLTQTNLANQAGLVTGELSDRQDRRNRNSVNDGSSGIPSTSAYLASFAPSSVVGQTGYQGGNNAPVNNNPSAFGTNNNNRPTSDNLRRIGRV